jgi:hypothetical protein
MSTFPSSRLPPGRGWVGGEVGVDEANVLSPPGRSNFEAATMLLADVDFGVRNSPGRTSPSTLKPVDSDPAAAPGSP